MKIVEFQRQVTLRAKLEINSKSVIATSDGIDSAVKIQLDNPHAVVALTTEEMNEIADRFEQELQTWADEVALVSARPKRPRSFVFSR